MKEILHSGKADWLNLTIPMHLTRGPRSSSLHVFPAVLLVAAALLVISTRALDFEIEEEFCPLSGPTSESNCGTMADNQERERTFIMIKPDGVQRGLVGEVIKRFEQKGFKLVALKYMWASEEHLKNHYADLAARPFFAGLVKYMNSGPVVPMVWEGLNVVKTGRQMLGETDPAKSLPGTLRGDYSIQVGRNIIHGSDSVEAAKHEINLWFKKEELVSWKSVEDPWLYE